MPRHGRSARFSLIAQWLIVPIGIVLGAVMGIWMHSATDNTDQEASSTIQVDQPIDPDQIITGNYYSSADQQQDWISGEVAFLTSRGFAEAVGSELNQPSAPKLAA